MQACIIHPFSGENEGELTVYKDEIVTVINSDVGSGWCEIKNRNEEHGFVPISFTSLSQNSENQGFQNQSSQNVISQNRRLTSSNISPPSNVQIVQTIMKSTLAKKSFMRRLKCEEYLSDDAMEGYVNTKVFLEPKPPGWQWRSNTDSIFKCEIPSHKESKKGLKTFVEYEIKTTLNNSRVFHRYNQFAWLLKMLRMQYPCICIPRIPEKKLKGNFEDKVIEPRKHQLEKWMNYISSHPVLSSSETVRHFCHPNDVHQWKIGKRKAEGNPFVELNFFSTVDPSIPFTETSVSLKRAENLEKFSIELEKSNEGLHHSIAGLRDLMQGDFRKKYFHISASLTGLASVLRNEIAQSSNALSNGIHNLGLLFKIFSENLKVTPSKTQALTDFLSDSSDIFTCLPSIANLSKDGCQFVKDSEQLGDIYIKTKLIEKTGLISCCVEAECQCVLDRHRNNLSDAIYNYLTEMAAFHFQMASNLTEAAKAFQQRI